jgi:hypothetical protein
MLKIMADHNIEGLSNATVCSPSALLGEIKSHFSIDQFQACVE